MHNYESATGRLPGPIRDSYGHPLLSWRVTILPYVEAQSLWPRFHRDEPWDSPNNLELLNEMPDVFASVGVEPPELNWTFYRLVTGPGTAFDRDGKKLADFADRTDNWPFIVEAGEAVPWTKPDEWEYSPDAPLPSLGGMFNRDGWVARQRDMRDGTNVAFGDGSVRFFPRRVDEQTWRSLITGKSVNRDSIAE
jgi:prepilin-type processing-associated H-X9-DG protein